jgi:hypothetical protein
MDYENIYESFYSNYYTKAEFLIKSFLIKRKSQKKTFGITINEVKNYFSNKIINNHNLYKNENLQNLHQTFYRRYSIYEIDHVQEIFANDIKNEFDKINTAELPTNYNYTKFIKEIAIIEVVNEILRLLSINSQLLEMFYSANVFDNFEIREHRGIALEHYPVYKKLHQILYPEYYEHNIIKEDLKTFEIDSLKFGEKRVDFDPNHFNKKGYDLFLYLVENYTIKEEQKIKYINIWYFLKRKVRKDIYSFSFTQEKYIKFILENYSIEIKKFAKAQYDFDEQVNILNSLEDQFRRQ